MAKARFPFMVFREAFNQPDGTNRAELLNDPKAPPNVRDAIRADINHSLETVEAIAARNTQRERHTENHALRDLVMAGFLPGKRGERQRLAKLHGVSERTIKGWIAQIRRTAHASPATTRDWRNVYYGEILRQQNRQAAKKRKG